MTKSGPIAYAEYLRSEREDIERALTAGDGTLPDDNYAYAYGRTRELLRQAADYIESCDPSTGL